MCELEGCIARFGKGHLWNGRNSLCVECECRDLPGSQREFCSRGLRVCSACSKKEFHEAYKSCWLRRRAQDRNDGREGEEGGRFILWQGCGGSHLQAWLNGRMLYDNRNIICLLKGQEKAPLIGFPDSLFYRTSSTEPCFQELSGKLALRPLVPPTM